MLLNKDTINLINSLRQINESIIFNYPVTAMKDLSSGTLVFINIKKLGNEEFNPFAIAKIKEFIDLIKIVGEDVNIDIDENGIILIKGNGFSSKYISSDVSIMESIAGVKLSTLDTILSKEVIAEFILKQSECEKAKRASDLLSLEDMNFSLCSANNIVEVNCVSKAENNKNFSFTISNENIKECKIDIKFNLLMSSIKKIPMSDFKCIIRKNEKDDSILAMQLIPVNCNYITFIIPCEVI